MNSQSPLLCSQMGSAFLAMNSSTGRSSMTGGRGTRFCFPLIKMVMNFFLRSRRAFRPRFVCVLDGPLGVSSSRSTSYPAPSWPLLVAILRRRLAHPLYDAWVGDGRDGMLDPVHSTLMIPVVAKVEPVTTDTIRLQVQVVQLGRPRVSILFFPWLRVGNSIVGPVAVERSFPELKLVQ